MVCKATWSKKKEDEDDKLEEQDVALKSMIDRDNKNEDLLNEVRAINNK